MQVYLIAVMQTGLLLAIVLHEGPPDKFRLLDTIWMACLSQIRFGEDTSPDSHVMQEVKDSDSRSFLVSKPNDPRPTYCSQYGRSP